MATRAWRTCGTADAANRLLYVLAVEQSVLSAVGLWRKIYFYAGQGSHQSLGVDALRRCPSVAQGVQCYSAVHGAGVDVSVADFGRQSACHGAFAGG